MVLRAPVGVDGIRRATSWIAKQGVRRLRDVSSSSLLVLDMLAGCKAVRRIRVDTEG